MTKRPKYSFELLKEHFKYKETEAAIRLGVSKTKLKRLCRQFNVPRWPFRRVNFFFKLVLNFLKDSKFGKRYCNIRESFRKMWWNISVEIFKSKNKTITTSKRIYTSPPKNK